MLWLVMRTVGKLVFIVKANWLHLILVLERAQF